MSFERPGDMRGPSGPRFISVLNPVFCDAEQEQQKGCCSRSKNTGHKKIAGVHATEERIAYVNAYNGPEHREHAIANRAEPSVPHHRIRDEADDEASDEDGEEDEQENFRRILFEAENLQHGDTGQFLARANGATVSNVYARTLKNSLRPLVNAVPP